MPLNKKGKEIMSKMRETYGPRQGEQIFYASLNKGRIQGVEGKTKKKKEMNVSKEK